ncbi:MAG: tryptophan synthase subunit alpha [Halobacteriaceae archaeon]
MNLEREFEEPALIPYITAGDPDIESTKVYVEALVDGGADIIELGLPFSEPIADGPTIQEAIVRSLEGGMTPPRYFDLVQSIDVDIPLVCMTYYNLVSQFDERSIRAFVNEASSAGIEGLIIPDLPVEEADLLNEACAECGVDLVFIIAPTTPVERMEKIIQSASGFLYVQARLGTTGVQANVDEQTHESLARIPETDLPRAVGFGVSRGEHAREIIAAGADGVVAGSVFVDIIADGVDVPTRLEKKAAELKGGALDARREPETERQ